MDRTLDELPADMMASQHMFVTIGFPMPFVFFLTIKLLILILGI